LVFVNGPATHIAEVIMPIHKGVRLMPIHPVTTEVFVTEAALANEKFVLPPYSRRAGWTRSRLMVMPDGSPMPVLRVLARMKFGEWDEESHYPVWGDEDWHHELLSNVELMERVGIAGARRPRSAYGIPSGTKEYHRAYHAANKDKVKAAQKKYHAKRRENLQKMKEELAELQTRSVAPTTTEEKGLSLLEQLESLVDPSDSPTE
jgi:hypothetical protein